MTETHHETLWRGFPKTLLEFEERFGTEEACREYLAACRWNGRPRCGRCDSDHVWSSAAARFTSAHRAAIRRA